MRSCNSLWVISAALSLSYKYRSRALHKWLGLEEGVDAAGARLKVLLCCWRSAECCVGPNELLLLQLTKIWGVVLLCMLRPELGASEGCVVVAVDANLLWLICNAMVLWV